MDTLAAVASMATASPLFQIPSAPSIKLVSNANSSILEGMMTSQDQQKTSTSNSPREDSASVTAVVASVNSVTTTTAATTTAVGVPAATSTTAPANGTSKSEQLPIGTSIVTPPMRMILKELHTPKPVPVRQYPVVPEIPAHITMDEFGLIQACEKGVVKSVRQIFNTNMKYYSNIDQQFLSSYGTTTTALIRSAERGRLAVVKYLVEELGADIDGPDAAGNTALMKSSFTGQLSIVQYLLSKEADVDVRNQAGDTVLFSAAVCGDVSILACLVQAGAEVQVQNHDGDTPLLKAVDLGSTASVEYLLEKGADIFTENKAGKTVFHLARVKEIKFVLAQRAQAIKEALANGIPMPIPIRKEETSSLKRKREDFEGNSNNKSEDEKESSIRKPSVSPLVTLADIACQQEESQAFGITSVPSVSNVPSSENEENKKLPGISLKAVDPSTGVNGKKKASSKRKAASALKSTASSNNDNIKVPVLPLNQLSSVFDDNKPTSSRSCISFDEQATIQPSRDIVLPTAPVAVNVASSSVPTTTVNWKLLYERELYMRITAETQVAALRDENGRLTNTIATMQWMQLMNKVNNPDASCDMDVSSAAFRSIADQLQSVTAATKPSSK